MSTVLNKKTLTVPFTSSYYKSSKPVYYKDPNDDREYLLIIDKHNLKTRLTKCDIDKDSYITFSEMDELIDGSFGYTVDQNTNKLYGTRTLQY